MFFYISLILKEKGFHEALSIREMFQDFLALLRIIDLLSALVSNHLCVLYLYYLVSSF